MKILVWGINYAPETTGIAPFNASLCEYLRATGHEVEMVTGFSYYPAWKKRPADCGVLHRREIIHGVPVFRCWQYVPARVRLWSRIVHEATFVLTSLLCVLSRPRPDLIIVISPPLLLGPAAWLVTCLRHTKYIFHVKDLQPDAALGVGLLRPSLFTRLLYGVEAFAYRHAWRVGGISRGMLAAYTAKGVPAEKQIFFPDGIRLDSPPPRGAFRARHGFGPDDFLAVYSGNLGVKQGLPVLVQAARLLRNPLLHVIICGDGAQRDLIEREAAGLANVHLLSLLPDSEYREMLADADLALIPQLAGSGRAFFPCKVLSALAFSRPILSVADTDSELARAVSEGGFGCNVLPDQPEALAAAMERLAADPTELEAWGKAGRTWVAQFEQDKVHASFAAAIESPPR